MSTAADVPGEFRAIKRQIPKLVVRSLLLFTTVYGVFITLSVPWSLYTVIFVDAKYSDWGAWDYVWGFALVLFGTLIMLRWCAVQCLAVREYDRYILKGWDHDYDYTPFVSILVPAYNETDTIVLAIEALIGLDYPRHEVIVIDDGSTDDTYAKALPLAGEDEHCTVTVISKPNGGKWSALNLAYIGTARLNSCSVLMRIQD